MVDDDIPVVHRSVRCKIGAGEVDIAVYDTVHDGEFITVAIDIAVYLCVGNECIALHHHIAADIYLCRGFVDLAVEIDPAYDIKAVYV